MHTPHIYVFNEFCAVILCRDHLSIKANVMAGMILAQKINDVSAGSFLANKWSTTQMGRRLGCHKVQLLIGAHFHIFISRSLHSIHSMKFVHVCMAPTPNGRPPNHHSADYGTTVPAQSIWLGFVQKILESFWQNVHKIGTIHSSTYG